MTVNRGREDTMNPDFVQESYFFLVSDSCMLCKVMDDQRRFISQKPPIYFAHNALHFATGNEKGSPPMARRGGKTISNFSILSPCHSLDFTGHSCRQLMWRLIMNVFHKQTSRATAAAVNLSYLAVYCPPPSPCALSLWFGGNNQLLANFLCLPFANEGY